MKLAGAKRYLLIALALAAIAAWFSAQFNRYYVGIAIDIGINIILAVSLNLINGHTGQFSLGHAGFMAIGAYTAATMTWAMSAVSHSPIVTAVVFAFALVIGGIIAAAAGLAVGVPTLRLRGDYLAIVTLGFGEIIRVVLQTTDTLSRNFGNSGVARALDNMGGASGMKGIATLANIGWAFGLAAVTVYVIGTLVNSTYGRGFIAVHDDEVAASAMGINPTRYKVTAFVIGAFFAGIAGGLYAHHKSFLSPSGFDFMKSIDIVVMVILGGMGRTAGVIIAAILLTTLPEVLRLVPEVIRQFPSFAELLTRKAPFVLDVLRNFSEYRMIIYALLIIVLMLLRPQGLFTFGKAPVGKA